MPVSRRFFLQKSSIALAGTAFFPQSLLDAVKAGRITGLQLYSVRDDMKKDPVGTLKALASMGYKHVEHANYVDRKFYGYSAADFKKLLDDFGLKMPSGHTSLRPDHWGDAAKDFTDKWKATIDDAATAGQKFVISPWMDEKVRNDPDALKHTLELFNKSGELCKKAGMKFGYHNHDFEISTKVGNETLYDYIIKNTEPALVIHQMDIGNFYGVGGRATDFIKRYPKRFTSLHVKDEIKSEYNQGGMEGGYESTILGTGVVDVKAVLKLAKEKGGTEHFIVEQESYQGKKPMDAVRINLRVMKGWGF